MKVEQVEVMQCKGETFEVEAIRDKNNDKSDMLVYWKPIDVFGQMNLIVRRKINVCLQDEFNNLIEKGELQTLILKECEAKMKLDNSDSKIYRKVYEEMSKELD